MATATLNKMTYQELASRIEKELSKSKTDRQTWDLVEEFWTLDREVTPELLDRVELLEARMNREHGWARH